VETRARIARDGRPQRHALQSRAISLQRGANLSQNCHLCAGTHDFTRWDMPLVTRPIVIGENAWLGADVLSDRA